MSHFTDLFLIAEVGLSTSYCLGDVLSLFTVEKFMAVSHGLLNDGSVAAL